MASLRSFSDLDAALESLDAEACRTNPPRSVLTIIAESRRLAALVLPLRERFTVLGDFDLAIIDKLPELIDRAQAAEVTWEGERIVRGRLSLHRTREEARALRSKLALAASHQAPDDPLVKLVRHLQERRSLPNLVADLRRLAEVVERHPEDFASAPSLPAEPAKVARALADALVAGDWSPSRSKARSDRNAAFALLAMAVEETRCAGRYLFRHEPETLASFADRAWKTQNRKRSRAKAEETSPKA
jgi:hypothetical protein